MNGNKQKNHRVWFAGLLGAAVITALPLSAQADQGKWWEPKQGGDRRGRVEQRDRYDRRGDRGNHYGWRNGRPRFQREVVVLRSGYRGRSYRAQRVYIRPVYFYRRHLIVVRPVRYYVGADFMIGGVRINARLHDRDRYVYGCNFCDERFGSYAGYEHHVHMCSHAPHGYQVDAADWDNDWNDHAWHSERYDNDERYEDGRYDDRYDVGDDDEYDN